MNNNYNDDRRSPISLIISVRRAVRTMGYRKFGANSVRATPFSLPIHRFWITVDRFTASSDVWVQSVARNYEVHLHNWQTYKGAELYANNSQYHSGYLQWFIHVSVSTKMSELNWWTENTKKILGWQTAPLFAESN